MATALKTLVRTDKPPIVFVSYSHLDEVWKDELLPHLKQLERVCELEVWDDRRIKAGVDWYAEIRDVLSRTKVAVCLITKSFLDSSFCMDEEIAYLLQARNRGDLEVMPSHAHGSRIAGLNVCDATARWQVRRHRLQG